MQKIIPHLWFDKEAKEAAHFYVSAFGGNSKILNINTIHDTPSGDCDIVNFRLQDYEFASISAGPYFKINPSISFMINFDASQDKNAKENLNELWKKLSQGGKALMPLDKYPFSELYGWIQDRYGVSWQLILANPKGEKRPFIIPSLMFTGKVCGKAEQALKFYTSIFNKAKQGMTARYPKGMAPDKESNIMFADFALENQWFAAMDSGRMHDFAFNEAISLIVKCDDQKELDHYWDKLSAVPESEQCGWLKDKFGVSWQITPTAMDKMMNTKDKNKIARVTQAFLKMKKFNIAELEKAAKG